MAAQASFDITSTIDLQEVDNALNQVRKEVGQRYDLKGAPIEIDFNRSENTVTIVAEDNHQLDAVWDVLQTRMVRRNVPVKNLKLGDPEQATGGKVRRVVTLQQGIPSDTGRAIVKFLKDQKLKKVQAAIQADQVRVSSPSKDDLQDAMRLLKGHDFGLELQFGNYRS
jgi:uncharacterized protein YajQ (UPF0234 family)